MIKLPKAAVEAVGEQVDGMKKSYQESLEAINGISTEVAKEKPNYDLVQQHSARLVDSLRTGEGHLHAAYEPWKMSPVHRRLHPGVR